MLKQKQLINPVRNYRGELKGAGINQGYNSTAEQRFAKRGIISSGVKTGLVFLLFLLVYLLIHSSVNGLFGVDDPYYHVKHSWLIEQAGKLDLIEPWLEFHFFAYAPTDPWWGYHLILAFFIHFFGPLVGAKIFAAILASSVFTVFYYIISQLKIDKPLVWTWLFFSSSSLFQFRLLLERPLVLSMSILPLAFWLTAKKRHLSLFFLALLYVIFYNLGPLVLVVAAIYLAAEYWLTKKLELRTLLAALAGILAGVLIHPRSLNYLYVMFIHFWQVLYLKFIEGVELGVGEEIQTKSLVYFFQANFLAAIFFLLAVTIFFAFRFYKKERAVIYSSLGLISFFWFSVTLFVPRAVDYWVPFAWLFAASVLAAFYSSQDFKVMVDFLAKRVHLKLVVFFAASALILIVAGNYLQVFNQLNSRNLSRVDQDFKQAGDWLKANSSEGAIVFYDNWSYWPMMFFYDDYNHYVTGMDPTFLYEYSPDLFWLWSNISRKGIYCERPDECPELSPRDKMGLIGQGVKESFRANYILASNKDDSRLLQVLQNRRQDFIKGLENEQFVIYIIK